MADKKDTKITFKITPKSVKQIALIAYIYSKTQPKARNPWVEKMLI